MDALRRATVDFAQQFDVDTLAPSEAAEMVGACTEIEASISSIKALSAVRSADSDQWKRDGYRSAADELAHRAGMGPSSARRLLDTGRRLAARPEVAAVVLAGELSAEQAAAVADGAAVNPGKAAELIHKARHSSMPELIEEVARAKAEVVDREARRKAIHARRSFRRWTDSDAAFRAQLYGNPEDGAGLWKVLDPIRRRLVVLRRESGCRDSLDALDYDSIMTMAAIAAGQEAELDLADLLELGLFPQLGDSMRKAPALIEDHETAPAAAESDDHGDSDREPSGRVDTSGAGLDAHLRPQQRVAFSPAKIMVRVDLDALLRGVPVEGELCEILGYGPVPVSVIERLSANGNAFLVGVLTRGREIVGIYHHRRRPNAHQSSALDFLYPSCAVKGCAARAGLQSDHREEWARTKFTVFDLLDRLCPHHHRLKTNNGWNLVEGTGKRDFVPPDHPRHPRYGPRHEHPRADGGDPGPPPKGPGSALNRLTYAES
jgi:hypothetical protein